MLSHQSVTIAALTDFVLLLLFSGNFDDAGFVLEGEQLFFIDKQSDDQKPRFVIPAEER